MSSQPGDGSVEASSKSLNSDKIVTHQKADCEAKFQVTNQSIMRIVKVGETL